MKKLLIMGSGNIGPINILTKNLRNFSKEKYQIDGLNLYKKGDGNVQDDYKYLDNIIELNQSNLKGNSYVELISSFKKKKYLNLLVKYLIQQRLNLKKAASQLMRYKEEEKFQLEIAKIASQYDIVNAHFLSYWQSKIIPLIPKTTRVVITFWGSDLMATAEPYLYSLQFHSCKRADAITVANSEMKEIVLSKFGRDLVSKTKITPFGVLKESYDLIASDTEDLIKTGTELIRKYNLDISRFKYRIKVGYNAFENQNHLEIIRQIALLPKEILEQIFLIIPMTYGTCGDNYIIEIESLLNKYTINGVVLKDYLSIKESVSLSCITNIMLNLRTNDAFNSSMTESLMAGALVINGAWLPYKDLKAKGLYYREIFSVEELKGELLDIISNKEEPLKYMNNQTIIKEWLVGAGIVEKWDQAYSIM